MIEKGPFKELFSSLGERRLEGDRGTSAYDPVSVSRVPLLSPCLLHDASLCHRLKSNRAKVLQIKVSQTVSHINPFLFLN